MTGIWSQTHCDYSVILSCWRGFPGSARGKEPACQYRGHGFDPWIGKNPWRRKWPKDEVTARRDTVTTVASSGKSRRCFYNSTSGLISHEQLERQAEFCASTQDRLDSPVPTPQRPHFLFMISFLCQSRSGCGLPAP